jgi:hypothetical protein
MRLHAPHADTRLNSSLSGAAWEGLGEGVDHDLSQERSCRVGLIGGNLITCRPAVDRIVEARVISTTLVTNEPFWSGRTEIAMRPNATIHRRLEVVRIPNQLETGSAIAAERRHSVEPRPAPCRGNRSNSKAGTD